MATQPSTSENEPPRRRGITHSGTSAYPHRVRLSDTTGSHPQDAGHNFSWPVLPTLTTCDAHTQTEDLDYQDSLGNRVIRNLRGLHHEVLQIWEVPRGNPTLIIVENGPFGITPMIEFADDDDDDGPILGDKMLGAERPVPGNPNKTNNETYRLSKAGVTREQATRDTSGAIKKLETSVRRKLSLSYDETRSLGNRSYSLCPPESVPKLHDSNTRHRNWARRAQSLSASFPPTLHDTPDQTPTTPAFKTPRTATPRPSPISDPRLRRSMVAATGTPSPSSSTTSITRSPAFRRRESNQILDLDLDRSLPSEPPVSPTARWATSPNASPNSIQITPTEAYSPPNSPFQPPSQRASPRLRRTRPIRLPSPAAFASRAASPLATSTSTSDATPLATPSVGVEDEAEAESQAEVEIPAGLPPPLPLHPARSGAIPLSAAPTSGLGIFPVASRPQEFDHPSPATPEASRQVHFQPRPRPQQEEEEEEEEEEEGEDSGTLEPEPEPPTPPAAATPTTLTSGEE